MLCGHPEPDKRMQGRSAVYKHPMSDARIGSEVAGYRIVSVLGQGGMGTVYLAEQTSPRRNVVVKLLRPDLSRDEAFRQRFVHESEAAASTEHPNIVPIYSAGEADGVLYIAMRYVEGDDLRHLIANRGPLPPDRAIEIVSQIASALDAAHARGLVHRDVKPGNILLDEGGNAYLSDFGLIKRSTVDTGLTETGQFMGSIEYCAPNRSAAMRSTAGPTCTRSRACCTNRSPDVRRSSATPRSRRCTRISSRIRPDSRPMGPGPVRELDPVVAKAMAKRPSDRYASAGEFARAARHAVGVTSGERQAAAPRSPRRRILLVAGAVAAALAVAGLALALSSGDDGTPPSGPAATGSLTNVGAEDRSGDRRGHAVDRWHQPEGGEPPRERVRGGGGRAVGDELREPAARGSGLGDGARERVHPISVPHTDRRVPDRVDRDRRRRRTHQSRHRRAVAADRAGAVVRDRDPSLHRGGGGRGLGRVGQGAFPDRSGDERDRPRDDPRARFDRDRRGGGRRLGDRQADGIC